MSLGREVPCFTGRKDRLARRHHPEPAGSRRGPPPEEEDAVQPGAGAAGKLEQRADPAGGRGQPRADRHTEWGG